MMSNLLLQQFSDEMAQTSANVQRALVCITDQYSNIGAGTIWHSDGLIITNAHVIAERTHHGQITMRNIGITLSDGEYLPAQVLAMSIENDLAALTVDAINLPTIQIGDSHLIKPGEWVMALGHPWGIMDSLTAGVVIGMGNNLPEMQPEREWIALDLKLRPGHSGGPLFNTSSELIGINTMISGPEVGFAIPAHIVKDFLKQKLGQRVSSAIIL